MSSGKHYCFNIFINLTLTRISPGNFYTNPFSRENSSELESFNLQHCKKNSTSYVFCEFSEKISETGLVQLHFYKVIIAKKMQQIVVKKYKIDTSN